MSKIETVHTSTTDGMSVSWRWATTLAIQPVLTVGVLAGALLFGLVSTAITSFDLPKFIPLVPGGLTLVFLGVAYFYTPVYIVGLTLDWRRVRASDTTWSPSKSILVGGGAQIAYFIVPIVQAYGGETFEELVFGSVELAALFCTGVVTVRYLAIRDNNLPGAPALVSLWSGVWSRVTRVAH